MSAVPLLAVGGSRGGARALSALLGGLRPTCRAAIVVALHRSAGADGLLIAALQRASGIPVIEAEDGMRLHPGYAVVAPPGYHLLVEDGRCALSIDAPVLRARPSIDVLFESVSWWGPARFAGVLLTGSSEDGARGLCAIKARGGLAFAQDPATAEAADMPLAAITRCFVDAIGTPHDIGLLATAALQDMAS